MTQKAAQALLAVLLAAFPFPEPPESTIRLYRAELEELQDEDAAAKAIRRIIREAKRLPPISEIRGHYGAIAKANANARADTRGLDEAIAPMPAEVKEWLRERGVNVPKDVEPEEAAASDRSAA